MIRLPEQAQKVVLLGPSQCVSGDGHIAGDGHLIRRSFPRAGGTGEQPAGRVGLHVVMRMWLLKRPAQVGADTANKVVG